ncbi:hypothetical protein VSS74_26935 [Conexibacter stalactiti]|uniref:ABC transporter permease n=1 Tax=Conexibacter stalactiti TaxID=1940611 RepID=A0ABU4HXS0_9ACTN|nr:hypothetical protein [Conexibacter stalactiti]MDW5598020.1 hypothetical protein [Conexibacter stalactiti]MEC5038662.1 hypothetical protein [Conexibacter stalactiti]
MFAVIEEPAGGAAVDEILIASTGALVLTIGLLVLGLGHRSGRVALLGNLARFAERRSGLPGWVALPSAIAGISLLAAVFGMYWDISLHIDVGRDAGPLANPAHYFILGGLFGIFAAGVVAIVLPEGKPSASSIQLGEGWYAPLGGLLVCASAGFALMGFPLDDVWHRLFGQDVTLWGPTHLMLIGGASLTLVGMAVLLVEGQRATGRVSEPSRGAGHDPIELKGDQPDRLDRIAPGIHDPATLARPASEPGWVYLTRRVALCGAFLLGLSTFQAEFDFGVPQFRFVFQPLLIMLAAGAGLVAVRLWAGRGAALGAVAFFLVVRGLLALTVGPILGQTTPHFPLFVVEALVVEAIALRAPLLRKPLAFGLASGIGIGTVGLAAEWGWTHIWMPIPWPSQLLPEAILYGLPTAVAGALIGAWIGDRLAVERRDHDRRLDRAALVAALGASVLIAVALYKPGVENVQAQVTLTDVSPAPQREVEATVRMIPADAADDAEWLTATAWQGDGFVVDRLERVSEGVYRTTQPIPVHGSWKALIRMHRGNTLSGVPIFLPEDRAIPAPEVAAPAQFTRTFVADHRLLQREQKEAQGWLWAIAYAVVGLITLSLLALMAWALRRLSAAAEGEPPAAGGTAPAAVRRPAPSAPRPTPHVTGA